MSGRPELAVVVLNWNNGPDTLECLASLAASDPPVAVVLVDNGSSDGSAEVLHGVDGVSFVQTGRNLGYAGGNDIGLRQALREGFRYVAVLNNDTVVPPQTFARLRAHLDAAEQSLAVSPTIVRDDATRSVWFQGGVVGRRGVRHLQPDEVDGRPWSLRDSELLTGCCLLATSSTWELVGSFDPRYFLIFEDSDWSLRARSRGVRLGVAGDCTIVHKVSRSFREPVAAQLGTYYFVRNGLRFHWQHARPQVLRFFLDRVGRPTVRRLLGRPSGTDLPFAWCGAAAAVLFRGGEAPTAVRRLAVSRSRR